MSSEERLRKAFWELVERLVKKKIIDEDDYQAIDEAQEE
jgi:hypothetical protein